MKRRMCLAVAFMFGISLGLGCSKGGGQSEIPTAPGAKVNPEDVHGMEFGKKKSTFIQQGK